MSTPRLSSRCLFTALCAAPTMLASACGRRTSDHPSSASDGSLAITHVTVIDMTTGVPRPDMTVITSGGKINTIEGSNDARLPSAARVVDGSGKYLIPGLWDMHVHSGFDRYERLLALPLFIANGITGIRDMAGDCFTDCADQDTAYNPMHGASIQLLHRWQQEIAAGTLLGPHMVVASAMLDGPHPKWPGGVAIHDTGEARAAVRRERRRGADFIKVYSGLSRENYLAIADEATRQGIPFAGHVPNAVSLEDAADAGQRSMEHLIAMPAACSTRRADVEGLIRAQNAHPAASPAGYAAQVRARVHLLTSSFSVAACAPLLQRFVRDSTWQVPTLTVLRGSVDFAWDSAFWQDPRQAYMARSDTTWWHGHARQIGALATPADRATARLAFHQQLAIVGAMRRSGVSILAGTDVSNPWVYWGASLHDELALLVEAGLTPLAALRTATTEPARFLRATDSLGAIAPGKVADMVLLDADPLSDIHNTQRIHAVIVRGQLVDSTARQHLLEGARRAAQTF